MDVGIHWTGWTAERARRCLAENTALPESVIENEVQRYFSWPAQALAYKIGELRILDERATAERALGPRFDIRAFRDAVIDDGPMPLTIFHEHMLEWLARTGSNGHN